MNKKKLSWGSLVIVLLLAGCILSGTFVIAISLSQVSTDFINGLVKESVDLGDNETWDDHSDDIKRIDKITFDAVVKNDLGVTSPKKRTRA